MKLVITRKAAKRTLPGVEEVPKHAPNNSFIVVVKGSLDVLGANMPVSQSSEFEVSLILRRQPVVVVSERKIWSFSCCPEDKSRCA